MQRWCRQLRAGARLRGNTVPAGDVVSDSDRDADDDQDSNASVHLYVPVDRDSGDSAGDGSWQNMSVEPSRHSSHVEGASYVPLQYMPQHTHSCPSQWHVFTDNSDSSDVDDPLVDLGHVFVPAQSTASANSIGPSNNFLVSTCGSHHLIVEGIEASANSLQN